MWNKSWKSIFAVLLIFPFFSITNGELNLDSERIVNSTATTIEEYPFIVSIQWFRYHLCGGVIISEKFVLTSAKCIGTFPQEELKILAGKTKRNDYAIPVQELKLAKINIHPEYNPGNYKNDIAILELATPLILDGISVNSIGFYVGPHPVESNVYATLIGWGVLVEGASFYPTVLHFKHMLSNDIENCIEIFENFGRFVDRESMFCISPYEPSPIHSYVNGGACDGDWGGPLVTYSPFSPEENIKPELLGLASWGFLCNEAPPQIYTDLQKMRTFIFEITGLWTPAVQIEN